MNMIISSFQNTLCVHFTETLSFLCYFLVKTNLFSDQNREFCQVQRISIKVFMRCSKH